MVYQEEGVRRMGRFPQPAIFNGVFGHIYQIDAPAHSLWPPPFTVRWAGNYPAPPAMGPAGKEVEVEAGAVKLFRGAAMTSMLGSAADADGGRDDDLVAAHAIALATGVMGMRKIRHNISDAARRAGRAR